MRLFHVLRACFAHEAGGGDLRHDQRRQRDGARGLVLWVSVLKSGVHATLAGVVLAFFIPLRSGGTDAEWLLRHLEQDLRPPVTFAILPMFAFANAGISVSGIGRSRLGHSARCTATVVAGEV